MAKPDKMLNEVPVAFVIANSESSSTHLAETIEEACQHSLADFKRPREVRIVESLPRATLEKDSKARLRELLLQEAR